MPNYNEDDVFGQLIDDIDNWDDDDLLLLDVEKGSVGKPSESAAAIAAAGAKTAQPAKQTSRSAPAREEESEQTKKKKGAPVGLIVLVIILLLIVGGILAALKLTNGDLSKLAFWKSGQSVEVTTTETAEEAELVEEEPETEEVEEVEEEEAEEEELIEVEEVEAIEEAEATAETTGALWTLWEGHTLNLVGTNNLGVGPLADTEQGTVDATCVSYLAQFIAAAREAGYNTICTSSCKYYEASADSSAEALEHSTGMAIDLIDVNNQIPSTFLSDDSMVDEIAWWAEHAYEYGFVLRYPADKEDVTGVSYNPYHFVYVTTSVAAEMQANNWCLEEYIAYINGELTDTAETTEDEDAASEESEEAEDTEETETTE